MTRKIVSCTICYAVFWSDTLSTNENICTMCRTTSHMVVISREGSESFTVSPSKFASHTVDLVTFDDDQDDQEEQNEELEPEEENEEEQQTFHVLSLSQEELQTQECALHDPGGKYFCLICNLDISRRSVAARCSHLKACSREHGIDTCNLMQLIRPIRSHVPAEVEVSVENEKKGSIKEKGSTSSAMGTGQTDAFQVLMTANTAAKGPTKNEKQIVSTEAAKLPKSVAGQMHAAGNAFSFLMQNARQSGRAATESVDVNAASTSTKTAKRQLPETTKKRYGRWAPACKKLQIRNMNEPIIIDGFQFSNPELSRCYFLTHFHSDHYQGLTRDFEGVIYCSHTTAKLVQLRIPGFSACPIKLHRDDAHEYTSSGSHHVDPVPNMFTNINNLLRFNNVKAAENSSKRANSTSSAHFNDKKTYITPLRMEHPYLLHVGNSQVVVTLIDANHCPGASMVLFEFPCGQRVLHTGDFRYDAAAVVGRSLTLQRLLREDDIRLKACHENSAATMDGRASLQGLQNKGINDKLCVYLDTTYCAPEHTFPSQKATIAAILNSVRKELTFVRLQSSSLNVKGTTTPAPGLKANSIVNEEIQNIVSNDSDVLFVFGAYQIGKEKVFLSVAAMLGCKVHVDLQRKKVMNCYDRAWEDFSEAAGVSINPTILTTDPAETNVWVEPMGNVTFKRFEALRAARAAATGRPCRRVVGFVPTGWSHTSRVGGKLKSRPTVPTGVVNLEIDDPPVTIGERHNKRGDALYSIPYSEHSSFPQLIQFIQTFRPARIVPTVGTTKAAVEEQLLLLRDASNVYSRSSSLPPFSSSTVIATGQTPAFGKSDALSLEEVPVVNNRGYSENAALATVSAWEHSSVYSESAIASADTKRRRVSQFG
jgi:hypothetical protein